MLKKFILPIAKMIAGVDPAPHPQQVAAAPEPDQQVLEVKEPVMEVTPNRVMVIPAEYPVGHVLNFETSEKLRAHVKDHMDKLSHWQAKKKHMIELFLSENGKRPEYPFLIRWYNRDGLTTKRCICVDINRETGEYVMTPWGHDAPTPEGMYEVYSHRGRLGLRKKMGESFMQNHYFQKDEWWKLVNGLFSKLSPESRKDFEEMENDYLESLRDSLVVPSAKPNTELGLKLKAAMEAAKV